MSSMDVGPPSAEQSSGAGAQTPSGGLRRNAVSPRLVATTAMSASAPAAGVILLIPLLVSIAGKAAIFTLVITLFATWSLCNTFAEFAKRIPSAGSLFAWNSAGLGSNVGFVFGWFFVGAYVVVVAEGFDVFGGYLHDYLQTSLSVNVPWWILTGCAIAYVLTFAWIGIRMSSEAAVAVAGFEMAVLALLTLWLLLAGDAHLSLSVFDPSNASGGSSAIGLAIALGVVAIAGFEEAATLGEEAVDPRRTVGRGLMIGITIPLVLYIFAGWIMMSSYPGGVAKFGADPNAIQTLATHVWHSGGGIITVILMTSILGWTLPAFNAGARVVYSLGRVGAVPAVLGRTNRHETPGSAIVLLGVVTVVLAYVVGAIDGALASFAIWSLMVSIAFAVVYIMTNFALLNYIRRYTPGELSIVKHVAVPLVAVLAFGYALYRTFHPLPPAALRAWPWVVVGWAVAGVGLLVYLRISKKADVEMLGKAFAAEYEEA